MVKKDIIETILIVIIAFLFCFPLFLIYSIQQDKINNIEKDVTEIKKELYSVQLNLLTKLDGANK